MRVLVVDDDYVSRTKLKALFSAYGDCDSAPNGELALELFAKAHEEGVPYELITLDIKMPGKEGKQVLTEIREWETDNACHENRTVAKIVMVSVMNDKENIMGSFRENCDGYLIKPVTPEKLREEMAKLDIKPAD